MKKRYFFIFSILIIVLIISVFVSVLIGSKQILASDILALFCGKSVDETVANIVLNIRLPRLIAAVVLGGALSVSGYLLQTFFGNPIAGPYVLGISSGAKLIVALVMIFLIGKGFSISSMAMVCAAFVGSLITMGFVLILSNKVKNMSLLVVIGIMIGYICSAITDFCITFASDSNIVNLHNWSLGSFSGIDWKDVYTMTFIVVIAVISSFLMSKPIGAYLMGENYASNMGVNVKRLRVILILLSSILSACVTAFAGPISFVGIAVPHMIKSIFKTSKPIVLIPACVLGGAVVTTVCDLIAKTVFAPTEISISSVTAVFLVPVVITMMIKKQTQMGIK